MKKIALITGATSGIGRATALLLAENGYSLILTGRRIELLDNLKKEIEVKYKADVLPLAFDIQDKAQVDSAINNLHERWKKIDVLINNAGLAAGLSHVQDGLEDDWERMIDTNIKGLLYITRRVAPMMAERKSGHIINIGSIAGTEVYENGNVYCATKHAVDALSKAMRVDLLKENVKVSQVRPGMVETEFSLVRYHGDEEKAKKVYDGVTPLFAEDIAQTILFVLTRPAHVNINDIVVTPTQQANAYYVTRNL
jgi:NADP-dependent 3-hydroxy acid dehydrogenase YdfG